MDWRQHIQRDPDILAGKPVFRGTRLSVSQALERLSGGWTEEQLLDAFPRLTREHIRAAQAYAAEVLDSVSTLLDDIPA